MESKDFEEVIISILKKISINADYDKNPGGFLDHSEVRFYAWSIREVIDSHWVFYEEQKRKEIIYWLSILGKFGINHSKRSRAAKIILSIMESISEEKNNDSLEF